MGKKSFYWHDYETWGIDTRRDRPSQFAGIRTDEDLNVIGEPLVTYCKPANDVLPHPEACLVTGQTPQMVLQEGLCEAEFIAGIHAELAYPGTCGVGYNSLRFDDEVTRFTLYRNFYDPYAREWQNGNSRWDIIDMARLTHALRPEGIKWPVREDGMTSFRLEELTAANGIAHDAAHDALSDVYATIELARLIRGKQPRLYDYVVNNRGKQAVAHLLQMKMMQPVLHVSGMFPAEHGHIALVIPVARHPVNKNAIIVYDLRVDPEPLISLDVDAIHRRVFTSAAELADDEVRIPLKAVHINKCPVIVPLSTLTPTAAQRWNLDIELAQKHMRQLQQASGLEAKIQQVHTLQTFAKETDPDLALYSGGFFSNDDRRRMDDIRALSPSELAVYSVAFDDARLEEMLFRYRARNWPDSLSGEDKARWQDYRHQKLHAPVSADEFSLAEFNATLGELRAERGSDAKVMDILNQLDAWGKSLVAAD